jgi:cytochrome c biogenesis protein CcdA
MPLASLTALWLGILTSISPCGLATNIAAVSFVSQRLASPRRVLFAGLLYTAGRMLTYAVLGVLVVAGAMSIPGVSIFLQKYMNRILGPVLIIVGMFLVGLLTLSFSGPTPSDSVQRKIAGGGPWGAGLLGIIFALTFCPVGAALFFGSLIPLSIRQESRFLLPIVYGIGTALPVIVFATMISLGANSISAAFVKATLFELWARRITGGVFILVGIYLSLKYIFELPLPF